MGQLLTKSEKRQIKEQTKKNTKVNRDMSINDEHNFSDDHQSWTKSHSSNVERQVSFNCEVKQLEYDIDNPGDVASHQETIGMLIDGEEDEFLDEMSEEGDGEGIDEFETSHLPPVDEDGVGTIEPVPPPRSWRDSTDMVDSIVIHKLHGSHPSHHNKHHMGPIRGNKLELANDTRGAQELHHMAEVNSDNEAEFASQSMSEKPA